MSLTGQFRPIDPVRGESGIPPKAEILLRYSEWSKRATTRLMRCSKRVPFLATLLKAEMLLHYSE
jgi:hypothetical protein